MGEKHVCNNVRVTRAYAPSEFDSRSGEGTFKVVNIGLENGMSISDVEGGEFFDGLIRLKVGDKLSFRYDRIGEPRIYYKKTESGDRIPTAAQGSLEGVEIFGFEEGEASQVFSSIMSREAKKAVHRTKSTTEQTFTPPPSSTGETATTEVTSDDLSKIG